MLDISVIILTYNEEIHIRRCIENAKIIAKQIFIVDSYSTDNTVNIAKEMGAVVYQNKWENNHAKQFNWGLNNLPIKTKWVLRLDADEYLTKELIDEVNHKLPMLDDDVSGITFLLKRVFMGREIKRGMPPIRLLRLFQLGKGQSEVRLMDEHIQINEGRIIDFENSFADDNLNDLGWWTTKHIGYATREAVDLLNVEFNLTKNNDHNGKSINIQAQQKRNLKHKYASQPLFLRSFIYFCYRYFFKMGFLEGKEGFMWHFFQGWWYRSLVDAKVFEVKKACGDDKKKITEYIQRKYNIRLS